MCTKCVDECPTGAIVKVNFPVKKAKPAAETVDSKPEANSTPAVEANEVKKEEQA